MLKVSALVFAIALGLNLLAELLNFFYDTRRTEVETWSKT